jgi:hypothetical protein
MDHAAPTWRLRGVFAAVVDVLVVLAGVAVVSAFLVAVLDPRANRNAAQLFAQTFKAPDEAGCPTAAGKEFWFSCASEVRRLHPAAAIAKDDKGAPAPVIPPPGPPR